MTIDPRTLTTPQRVGTRVRDAAVDPRDTDFLAPTNAGAEGELGNPHGPHVVNPEIHALQDVHPVRPGPVSPDLATQEANEVEHLEEYLADAPAPAEPTAPDAG